MRYLLDTTVIVPYLAGDQSVKDLLETMLSDGIAIAILSYLEAYQGAIEDPDPLKALQRFEAFVVGVPVLPVSLAVARRCAEIRSLLKRQGKNPRRRGFDLVIAATALDHGLELVTHNLRDYRDIPYLVVRSPQMFEGT